MLHFQKFYMKNDSVVPTDGFKVGKRCVLLFICVSRLSLDLCFILLVDMLAFDNRLV